METKKLFKYFSIFNHEKEQEFLRNMHNSGWKFVKVKGLGTYLFEKCTPQDVIYQLDYQEKLKDKTEYIKMFADCGWEYLQEFAGYTYFRKPAQFMDGDEEIFCDDESRLLMMKRVFNGRMIPMLIIFLCILIPRTYEFLFVEASLILGPVFVALFIVYVVIFIRFAIKYKKYKDKVSK